MSQISKKTVVIILVLLMAVSTISSLTQVPRVTPVYGQSSNWPGTDVNGDGNVDILDTIQYVKLHYVSYNPETGSYSWSFADPHDSAMADFFMQSILNIEYIRNANHDKNVFEVIAKLLTMYADGLTVTNSDGTPSVIKDDKSFVKFAIKNFLADAAFLKKWLDPLFSIVGPVSKVVSLLRSAGLSDIEIGQFESTLITYMVDEGGIWLTKVDTEVTWVNLKFDSASADSLKYPKLAGLSNVFRVAMAIYDFANVFAKHILDIIEIGKSTAMESVKQYEIYQVEMIRLCIEIVGKIAKTVGEGVIQPAYAQALMTVCAGLAIGGGPAGIVAALVVATAGIILYYTVSDIVDKAINFAADETLGLDLAIYKKLSASPNEVYIPLYEIKILGISDQDEDNYIPWGPGSTGEDVYVVVRNTGVRTINLRVDPTIDTIDPATGKTGWSIVNKDPWATHNWIEKTNFNPGDSSYTDFCFHVDSGTVQHGFWWPFTSKDDVWIPGENPAGISFAFNHDVLTEWWDIFDFGGLKYITESFVVFYNSVDVLITVHGGLDITNGDTLTRQIDVKNLKTTAIVYTPEVHLIDPFSPMNKYDSQITILPNGPITVQPQEISSFNIQWTAPPEAPIGYYDISVNAKGPSGENYIDNLVKQTIFYLYKLNIVLPTSAFPAEAGDPNNPNQVYVYVKGLPPQQTPPTFFVRIGSGGGVAQNEIIDELPYPVGYTLKVTPPSSPVITAEGKYDLEVNGFWGDSLMYHSSDKEQNAVEYTTAPSAEPIQRGLAWLRTRQAIGSGWGDVGVRSLELLAFLNAGYDETDSYVSSGIQFLLANVQGGAIYNDWHHATYQTSLAMLALIATHNDNYKTTIENAKNWLVSSQWDESCIWGSISKDNWYYGGFGYGDDSRPDLSNTQFALLALDAAGLPKTDSTWQKVQVFLHRCQRVNFPITVNIDGSPYPVQPGNYASDDGGYDGGFVYTVDNRYPYGGSMALGSMTGAGIWGLLLSGVGKTDPRVTSAFNWVVEHYTWDTNVGAYGYRRYYTYLSLSKALTMYGEKIIGGHDWYQELYNKITSPAEMIAVGADQAEWIPSTYEDYVPDLSTAYAILSLQTRAGAPPVQRLSYLTFILRSNCLIRIIDPDGNLAGYNYLTGTGENNIPTAVYSGQNAETQYIVIVNPKPGTYKLELVGISQGPYTLDIQGNYGEEVTKTFEYTGETNPGELDGSQVMVTAIVGPMDVYANPPTFEKIIDNIPPTTTLTKGQPQYTDLAGNLYITSSTPLSLTAEDNVGGTGVASTGYSIRSASQDFGGATSTPPIQFYMTGFADGTYFIDYNSTDAIGNVESTNTATVILDNAAPTTNLNIGDPKYVSGRTYVTPDTPFTLTATDPGSGVKLTTYRINSTSYDGGWQTYINPFKLSSLADGNYTIAFNSTDNVGNVETTHRMDVKLFSWNYVFKDSDGRGTILKICTPYKFFQFIAPDKDFGVRYASKMTQLCKQVTITCYEDSQMRLTATAVDDKTCVATVCDKQTGKTYWLIEHPPTYKLTICCKDINGKAISGANVYLNGCCKGQTDSNGNLIITNVLAGTYTVTVKKCGYKDSSSTTTLTEDATLTITLTPQTYTLTVCCKNSKGKAISGVSVYVNSIYRGTTDPNGKLVITNITAGTYTVTVKKTGYKDTSVNVTISSDKTVTITMK